MKCRLSTEIYPLDAIINACYAFIDRAYISLDTDNSTDSIEVEIKPKAGLSSRQKKTLVDDFKNELLHSALRYQISKNNKKIREYIIGRALYNPPLSAAAAPENDEKLDYLEDPLGIAIPWEKKYGKKKKCASKV